MQPIISVREQRRECLARVIASRRALGVLNSMPGCKFLSPVRVGREREVLLALYPLYYGTTDMK